MNHTARTPHSGAMLAHVVQRCDVIAGRLGAAAFVLMFFTVYCAVLFYFGIAIGVALGWLPAFVAAWFSGHVIVFAMSMILRKSVMLRLWLWVKIPPA